MRGRTERWRIVLDTVATVGMIVASASLVWALLRAPGSEATGPARGARPTRPAKAIQDAPISLDGAKLLGSRSARVALLEFSDYECPFCSKFHAETYPALVDKYVRSGQVLFGFRHFPIEAKHPLATKAAEAAECAGRQERFWPMHDELFRRPVSLEHATLMVKASQLKLDMPSFRNCLEGQVSEKVKQDVVAARQLSITGTPAFLIGTMTVDGRLKVLRHESGAMPKEVLDRILQDLLKSLPAQ